MFIKYEIHMLTRFPVVSKHVGFITSVKCMTSASRIRTISCSWFLAFKLYRECGTAYSIATFIWLEAHEVFAFFPFLQSEFSSEFHSPKRTPNGFVLLFEQSSSTTMARKRTEGYSGAEIQAICQEAALKALEENLDVHHVLRLYEDYMKKS
uniref:AAA ATPase AAA+ lid domain-containing protein n=1 Tax=Glossina palpalis gambiensis TaxID=67801 RepID=A0A1B0BRM7_9MUSC